MRAIEISTSPDGQSEITVERGWWIFKKTTRYKAVEKQTESFSLWVKLPHKTRIGDAMSFQLDAWKKHGI